MGNLGPILYDQIMKFEKLTKINKARRNIIQQASGKVLEIGSGTGRNFPFYTKADSVDAIEPNWNMLAKSKQKSGKALVPMYLHQASAEDLPFSKNRFDTVISTLVFCSIPNPLKALEEIQRVAKPGARILFLEHVEMNHQGLANIQNILTPAWKRIADGCHLNRNLLSLIEETDMKVVKLDSFYNGLFLSVTCTNSDSESPFPSH